jgi:hypothetical protein
MKINNIKISFLLSLLAIGVSTQASADCQYTSFQRNGVYAYGFEVSKRENGTITGISLYLGTFIGSMSSMSDTVSYNGQTYGIGAYRDKIATGKNGANERWEYEACTVGQPAPPVTTPPVTTPSDPGGGYVPPVTTPVDVPPPTVIPPNVPQVNLPSNYDELCNYGYTGKKQHVFSIYYTSEMYNTVMSDGTPTQVAASTPHVQETINDMCVLVPTQVAGTNQGTTTVSCDSYYGTAVGTYIGVVTKYHSYTSTYSSGSLETNTSDSVSYVDTTACLQDPSKIFSLDSMTEACPSGQQGSVYKTRYKAVDKNGVISYPNGTTWNIYNTCAAPDSDKGEVVLEAKAKSLISNIGLTSSLFISNLNTQRLIDNLSMLPVNTGEHYTFNLTVDDLSYGSYNINNINRILAAYDMAVKGNASYRVTIPKKLSKYIGNQGLKDIDKKEIKSAIWDGKGEVKVTYYDYKQLVNGIPKEVSFSVPLLNTNVKDLTVN